jgi:hypothetical protein
MSQMQMQMRQRMLMCKCQMLGKKKNIFIVDCDRGNEQ